MMITERIRRLAGLVKKGVLNPGVASKFISKRIKNSPARIHNELLKYLYPSQESKLSNLRSSNNWALIVLDACRFDRFDQLASEYIEVETIPVSAAANDTFGYLRKCWSEKYNVDYVSGAAPVTTQDFDFSDDSIKADGIKFEGEELYRMYQGYTPSDHISNIYEVWKTSWDESLGVCPPEPVTDKALEIAPDADRLVVHYFQPHEPYIGDTKLLGNIDEVDDRLHGGAIGRGIWDRIESGEISDQQLRRAYDDNLRRVLTEVAVLIQGISGEFDNIAIMGDHGEALGEYNQYTHSISHPKVRLVPWGTIHGYNEDAVGNRFSSAETVTSTESSVENRLQDLGYI